jgi:hypothetical protein
MANNVVQIVLSFVQAAVGREKNLSSSINARRTISDPKRPAISPATRTSDTDVSKDVVMSDICSHYVVMCGDAGCYEDIRAQMYTIREEQYDARCWRVSLRLVCGDMTI